MVDNQENIIGKNKEIIPILDGYLKQLNQNPTRFTCYVAKDLTDGNTAFMVKKQEETQLVYKFAIKDNENKDEASLGITSGIIHATMDNKTHELTSIWILNRFGARCVQLIEKGQDYSEFEFINRFLCSLSPNFVESKKILQLIKYYTLAFFQVHLIDKPFYDYLDDNKVKSIYVSIRKIKNPEGGLLAESSLWAAPFDECEYNKELLGSRILIRLQRGKNSDLLGDYSSLSLQKREIWGRWVDCDDKSIDFSNLIVLDLCSRIIETSYAARSHLKCDETFKKIAMTYALEVYYALIAKRELTIITSILVSMPVD